VGTVRGAVTTMLLASSAIGGAVTVNNVRQDIAKDQSAATPPPARVAAARATPSPTPTPLTAGGLRADAEKRLRAALDQNAQGADDLRKVSPATSSWQRRTAAKAWSAAASSAPTSSCSTS